MSTSHVMRRSVRNAVSALIVITTAGYAILGVSAVSAEGNDTIYLTPNMGTYNIGSEFTVEIRENSNNEQVNAVQADLGYPQSVLQFVSIDDSGSAFGVSAEKTGGNGTVTVTRGNTTPLTGDKLVARVRFKAIGAGSPIIEVKGTSVIVSHATNQNIADTRSGGTYTVVTGGSPAPPPPPPPGPPGPPGPAGPSGNPGRPAPIPTTRPIPVPAAGAAPNVTITPSPSAADPNPNPTILPDDSEISVDQPAVIETTPSNSGEVVKVEYLINKKLVATVNEPPFSYAVDTANMRNGKYILTTKTHYEDGRIDSSDTALVVKNAFGPKQLMLQLRHYAWLIILLLIGLGAFIWFKFFRSGGGNDEFGDGYGGGYGGGDYAPTYGDPNQGNVVAPGAPQDPNAGGQYPQYPPTDPNAGGQQYPPGGYGPR